MQSLINTKAARVSEIAFPKMFAGVRALISRQKYPVRRLPWLAMLPADIGLFLKSARTDARVAGVRRRAGSQAAFDSAYRESDDPWASASPCYRYQSLKYEKLVALLPRKRFENALDLGCGLGLLSQRLTSRAGHVLGMDISPVAIGHACRRARAFDKLTFEQGDILNLPSSLDGKFDLVVAADVLYYLSPLDEDVVTTPQVDVTGSAPAGTVISINDQILTVGIDGQFKTTVTLDEGPNLIEVVASDENGNEMTVLLTVTYEP